MQRGAIILCGGKSQRMGQDKASLPFGELTMLEQVVLQLAGAVRLSHIVVVAAADQQLPPTLPELRLVHDQRPERGPLEGLAAGLTALQGEADAIFLGGCDTPLLTPEFTLRMFDCLENFDTAVPSENGFRHPLSAVYRTSVLPKVQEHLAADRLKMQELLDELQTYEVPLDVLREVDPDLHSLKNVNDPESYRETLRLAGLEPSGQGGSEGL